MTGDRGGLPSRIDGGGSNPGPACERIGQPPQRQSGAKFPTLAEVIESHADMWMGQTFYTPAHRFCTCGWRDQDPTAQYSRASFADHVQDEWRKACAITTVEQLDSLPIGAVILTTEGRVAVKSGEHWGNASGYGSWWSTADEEEFECGSDELDDLPARVLYRPEDDQ